MIADNMSMTQRPFSATIFSVCEVFSYRLERYESAQRHRHDRRQFGYRYAF